MTDLMDFARKGMAAQKAVDAATADARWVLAIDPGPTQSAYVGIQGRHVMQHDKVRNETMLALLEDIGEKALRTFYDHVAIEMISNYGNAVGAEVFETVFWIGRFFQAAQRNGAIVDRVFRHEVKMTLCMSPRAKDANIRAAIIDIYGPGKDKAVGRKASPGPLYGITIDRWQALAVGLTLLGRAK